MTRTTVIKAAVPVILGAAAIYTHYGPPLKAGPEVPAISGHMSDGTARAAAGQAVKRAVAVYNMGGHSRQEETEAREPFELAEKYPPLDLVAALLDAPFGQEPGEAVSEKSWRVLAYPPEYCDPPAYSRTFRKKGPGLEINLHAYAVPSLTEAKELVLSGELKIFREVRDEEVLAALKAAGFQTRPTEKHLSSPGGRNWSGVMEISGGGLSGLLYRQPHGAGSVLRMNLEHKDAAGYSVRLPAVKEAVGAREAMPDLVAALEENGAEKLIGPDWREIKPMLLRGPVMNTGVAAGTLLAARAACLAPPGDADGAPFLVLAKHLLDAALAHINHGFRPYPEDGKAPEPPPGLKLLEEYGVAYELEPVMRESYSATVNSLIPAYESYPASYWGQYAFTREMELGFPATGDSDDMRVVMEKGEDFLAAHPDSPFLPRVLFLLGKANETAYSIGLSPSKYDAFCSHTYCVELEQNTEKHRLDAIKHFTRLLSLPGGKEYEEHLKYVLPRLRTKGNSYGTFYISCGGC
ncbi:MAG: hypothetical protein AB1734_04735 [Elusimicrobiota bacterium]